MKEQEPKKSTEGIFIFKGGVEASSEKGFFVAMMQFAERGIKTINLYVSSHGGDVDEEHLIIQEMEKYQRKGFTIRTIARGYAESAATAITLMGTKGERMCYPDTRFFLHHPKIKVGGELPEVRNDVWQATIEQRRLEKKLATQMEITPKELKQLYGKYIFPDEAIRLKMIDKIYLI